MVLCYHKPQPIVQSDFFPIISIYWDLLSVPSLGSFVYPLLGIDGSLHSCMGEKIYWFLVYHKPSPCTVNSDFFPNISRPLGSPFCA